MLKSYLRHSFIDLLLPVRGHKRIFVKPLLIQRPLDQMQIDSRVDRKLVRPIRPREGLDFLIDTSAQTPLHEANLVFHLLLNR